MNDFFIYLLRRGRCVPVDKTVAISNVSLILRLIGRVVTF